MPDELDLITSALTGETVALTGPDSVGEAIRDKMGRPRLPVGLAHLERLTGQELDERYRELQEREIRYRVERPHGWRQGLADLRAELKWIQRVASARQVGQVGAGRYYIEEFEIHESYSRAGELLSMEIFSEGRVVQIGGVEESGRYGAAVMRQIHRLALEDREECAKQCREL